MAMIKTMILLVGVPAVGKSTFIQSTGMRGLVLSSDALIEKYAAVNNKTYTDVFTSYIKTANKLFETALDKAIADGVESIIIDRTNTTKKARKRLISKAEGYRIVAIDFDHNHPHLKEQAEYNLFVRNETTGKFINPSIVEDMKKAYEKPSFDEGIAIIINPITGETFYDGNAKEND